MPIVLYFRFFVSTLELLVSTLELLVLTNCIKGSRMGRSDKVSLWCVA